MNDMTWDGAAAPEGPLAAGVTHSGQDPGHGPDLMPVGLALDEAVAVARGFSSAM